MIIIGIKGYNFGIKTDTEVYFEGLRNLGHTVLEIIFEGTKAISEITVEKMKTADIIWCPYERETVVGVDLRKHFNIPLVGHYEWVPPWRVSPRNGLEWGYTKEEVEKIVNTEGDVGYYKSLIPFYNSVDMKTISTKYCLDTVKALGAEDKNLRTKPYIIDDKLLLSKKDNNIKEENQILTIGRLVPHKRIHHIIRALALLDNPPLLKIIGYGPYNAELKKLISELGVSVSFAGFGQKGDKAIEIQKSLFLVTPCASLPCGEAALFKKPTLMYDNENMIEKHGNMGKYVKNNSIEELSKAIKYWLDNPEEVKKEGQNSYDKLINNESGLKTTKNACKEMIKIFEEVIK